MYENRTQIYDPKIHENMSYMIDTLLHPFLCHISHVQLCWL